MAASASTAAPGSPLAESVALLLASAALAAVVGHRRGLRLAGCVPFLCCVVRHRWAPGDAATDIGWSLLAASAWSAWSILLLSLPGCLLARRPVPPLRWLALAPWGLFLQLYLRVDADDPGPLTRAYVRVFWDPPLLWAAQAARLADSRLLRPFASELDANLTLGSLPMTRDVPWLHEQGVRGVVNMCAEWPGPVEEYQQAGIAQLRLPTVDTTSPTVDALERGVAFIRETLARGNRSGGNANRVFVHCKAGMGRAATMALSWYISQGRDPGEAMRLLKAKRPVVSEAVLGYRAVRELIRRHAPARARTARARGGGREPPAAATGQDEL